MFDRRKHPRALLPDALEGTLRLTEDVVVESFTRSELTVVSGVPARSDQWLAIAPGGSTPHTAFDVRVTESTPAVVNGVLRHRLRLRVAARDDIQRSGMRAALVRDVPVRVLDVGAGGCLLETGVPVNHGVAGELQVPFDGHMRSHDVRVCRASLVPGAGSMFRLGAEFTNGHSRSSLWEAVKGMMDRRTPGATGGGAQVRRL